MTDETDDTDGTDETQVNPTVRQSTTRGFTVPDPKADNAAAPVEEHSALVGYMSVPVHRRLPIRRSTLVLIVLFLGFGTLCYLYPPNSANITCANGICSDSNGNNVGVLPPTATTSTTAPTTTTSTTSTTVPTSGGHVGGPTTTTTTGRPSPATTTTSSATGSTTTTRLGTAGSTTTSTATGISGTGTTTTTRP